MLIYCKSQRVYHLDEEYLTTEFHSKLMLKPVIIRPYRYPLTQKDIIQKLVQEMLDSGIVQPSSSPFASPVVLLNKKDGSWRLCVDYMELNSKQ